MFPAAVTIRHDRLEPSTITSGNLDLDPRAHAAMLSYPYSDRDSFDCVYALGTKEEIVASGCFDAHRQALLASDPKSGELGGAVRVPAGRSVDEDLVAPRFDAAKVSVPVLVIRGDADTNAPREDNQQLMAALGSTLKEYVEIPNGGHFLHFENVNMQFYEAVQNFLEAEE